MLKRLKFLEDIQPLMKGQYINTEVGISSEGAALQLVSQLIN
jgi:hypothetical protein